MAGETEVQYNTEIFQKEMQANAPSRLVEVEDWAFYAALEFGQYNASALRRMQQQGRQPLSFNLIMKNIDTEAGMLLQQPFEFHYEADFGQRDQDAFLANELRMRDKDIGKWARQKQMFVVAGLVNTGILELFVDYSQDEMGAPSFRYRIPTDFMFDSNWRGDDINNNKQIFEFQYLDPEEIKRTYGKTADKLSEIEAAITVWKVNRAAGRTGYPTRFSNLDLEKNGRFLVIQMQEMAWETKTKLYNPKVGTFLNIDISDKQQLREFIQLSAMNGISLLELPKDVRTCQVKSFAPALSMTNKLADGPHPLQVGRYPLVTWSAYNVNGKRFGRVSQYKDPQSVFNKRIATFLHWQMTASLGTKLIGPGAFEDDAEKQRYIDEHNIPGSAFDVLDATKISNDQREMPPTDLIKVKDDAKEFIDYIGPGLAAQGRSENSSESGLFFNAKREQAQVTLELESTALEHCDHEMGEMYLAAVPQIHGNAPKTFKSSRTGQNIFINTDQANNIKNLGRLSVRVTSGPVGESVKRENLAIFAKLRQAAKNPLEDSVLALETVDLIPGLAEDKRSVYKESLALVHEQNVLQTRVAIGTLRMQLMQIESQVTAMKMQSGAPGMPPQGMPPRGLPQATDASFTPVPAAASAPGSGPELPVGALSNG
jgi:hypothetical protein